MTPLKSILSILAGVLLLAFGAPLQAANYCVGSVSQLQDALDQAEGDGADSLIQVRSGTYNLTSDLRYQPALEYVIPAGKLTVRGGYNSDCSSYSLAQGATTIDGGGTHSFQALTETGAVALLGLKFQSAFVHISGEVSNGSLVDECSVLIINFSMRRVRVDSGSVSITAPCQDVVLENVLVSNGIGDPDSQHSADTGLWVYLLDFDNAASLTMVNSSIVNARTTFLTCCGEGAPVANLYNSIFHRPAGADIFSEAVIYSRNNRYDDISFSSGAFLLPGSGSTSSANPDLNAQHVPNAGSPMINSGSSNVPDGLPTTDLSGGERVIGSQVDRGALESPVDGTGVYTVTNTNASGSGSLAQAVELANTEAGMNYIRFNITGGCPRRISLAAPLQIRESVSIDGWSQPGNVLNTSEFGWTGAPCIILNGAGSVGIGIEAMGELASGGRITVRGLAFEGFDLAIALAFGEDHAIYGNQFGGNVGDSFLPLSGNQQAIGLIGGGRTTVGGWSASSRNLIGASSDVGVLITTFLGGGGDDNEVINNLIGLDKNGANALPNGTGIRINGGFNRIAGNRIGGNTIDGILLSSENAEGNIIDGNDIGGGLGAFSLVAGNGRMGVMLQNEAHDNRIGPANIIGRNGDDGVRVMPTARARNEITANRINRNDALGIDLGDNGVTANDPDPTFCDPDLGCAANRGQNFPVVTEAVRKRTGFIPVDRPVLIRGTLRSTVNTTVPYRIELFSGPSCEANGHGEGLRMLGQVEVIISNEPYCSGDFCLACTNGNCTAAFATYLPLAGLEIGDAITATATSPAGDTSEFSACAVLVDEDSGDLPFADSFEGD